MGTVPKRGGSFGKHPKAIMSITAAFMEAKRILEEGGVYTWPMDAARQEESF